MPRVVTDSPLKGLGVSCYRLPNDLEVRQIELVRKEYLLIVVKAKLCDKSLQLGLIEEENEVVDLEAHVLVEVGDVRLLQLLIVRPSVRR